MKVLKSMLQNLASDASAMRKDSIPDDDVTPELQSRGDEELSDFALNQDSDYSNIPESI